MDIVEALRGMAEMNDSPVKELMARAADTIVNLRTALLSAPEPCPNELGTVSTETKYWHWYFTTLAEALKK